MLCRLFQILKRKSRLDLFNGKGKFKCQDKIAFQLGVPLTLVETSMGCCNRFYYVVLYVCGSLGFLLVKGPKQLFKWRKPVLGVLKWHHCFRRVLRRRETLLFCCSTPFTKSSFETYKIETKVALLVKANSFEFTSAVAAKEESISG